MWGFNPSIMKSHWRDVCTASHYFEREEENAILPEGT
jgi:hypothetical protein